MCFPSSFFCLVYINPDLLVVVCQKWQNSGLAASSRTETDSITVISDRSSAYLFLCNKLSVTVVSRPALETLACYYNQVPSSETHLAPPPSRLIIGGEKGTTCLHVVYSRSKRKKEKKKLQISSFAAILCLFFCCCLGSQINQQEIEIGARVRICLSFII